MSDSIIEEAELSDDGFLPSDEDENSDNEQESNFFVDESEFNDQNPSNYRQLTQILNTQPQE